MLKSILVSKMHKTNLMLNNSKLAKHIPLTKRLNRQLLSRMLEQHGMIYVKPDKGSQGKGVIRVEKIKQGYRYQSGVKVFTFTSFSSMFSSICKHFGHRQYLVQKGVHLLKYNGRPFDFRVMIQRNPKRKWECTGTIGRLAHPGKAVTNGSQGGTIYEPSVLLAPFANKGKTAAVLRGMNRITHVTAARLSQTYPHLNELGLDIGLDRRLKPWILEVNTYPDAAPFSLLPNPKVMRTIVAYGKAYGRHHRTTCTKAKRAP
ncbi:YheC/D like ATP-grasp [Paenibacillus uliginis N3/975]|uniref:YheC/D like ATP-grasp n=1 Tax=Paenibacillus uliginis N3/975 TaxID=1313296 RepID=A0A1X7GV39_9BACL|nr:YheC/YheD family protein [Paenibacillus uliginis]SMF74916.1 YheC/D like ATP-grasp [Paenibacillus uliginis N3/975]